MTLRVLNVNDTLDLKTGGGTAERTFQMSRHLARHGAHCQVLTIDSAHLDDQRVAALKPAELSVLPCLWRRFNFPRMDWRLIRKLVDEADVIHLMGHWSILNVMVYFAARRVGKPYVMCPAGALPLFGRSRWLKRAFNFLVGSDIVLKASGWIAVTEGEFQQFEEYGVPSSRVTIIPNGVSKEDFPLVVVDEFKRRRGLPDAPIILFMGRLNPIKGPDLLLESFILARSSFPDFHLVFAGPDGGMQLNLQKIAEQNGVSGFVHFLGHVAGTDRTAAYRMASLLVVPSRQEAMSIVAIEAGICGVPVLLTDQCGFGEIQSIDTRLEVQASVSGIAGGLTSLLAEPATLQELSPAWSSFVERKYSWPSLVSKYLKLYQQILAGAA